MKYRNLGNSGLKVSEISLGSYLSFGETLDEKESLTCIHAALDQGINFFDTADSYARGEAERILGKAFKGLTRESFVISTKCYMPRSSAINAKGLSRKNLRDSVTQSLKNLNIDYIDILLCHRFDNDCPLEETIAALDDLVHQGYILYWGVSRWNSEQMLSATALAGSRYKPIANQYFYNLLNREAEEIIPTCSELGIGLVAYAPLAQGVLTGKYATGIPKNSRASNAQLKETMWHLKDIDRCSALAKIASEAGIKLHHLALAWCLKEKIVSSVLIGARSPEQIIDNVKAVGLEIDSSLVKLL